MQETSTQKEQKILKKIQELKSTEKSQESKEEIERLECELSAIQGKDINAIEAENIVLRKKAITLEKELNEARKRYSEMRKIFGSIEGKKPEDSEGQNEAKLARLLLKKYSQLINEKEAKTVGEIKKLVTKDDLTIQAIAQEIKPEQYSFEKNYEQTAEKALKSITEDIEYAKADFGINFWLEPKEIMEAGTSDDEDLAVMLCSTLYTLGDEKAQVVIAELDNLSTHAMVTTETNGKFYILDPSQKHSFGKFSGKKEEALKAFEFKGAKIKRFLYKFNTENYEQFI